MTEEVIRRVAIVIPVHNDFECFKDSIDSIINSTMIHSYEIVIIESGSTDGAKEYADLLPKIYPNIKFVIIHTPLLGPLDAMQRGFQYGIDNKCHIYFTQTDVIHHKLYQADWLCEYIMTAQNPNVGLVSCYGGGGISGPSYYEGVRWIGAWSMFVPYRTLIKVGKYDENYEIGHGVDIDYTVAVQKAGLYVIELPFWVEHHRKTMSHSDGRKDIHEIALRNGIYFRKKFSLGEFAK
jgi:glycosyltransferase involved in cell wall biosynthesis